MSVLKQINVHTLIVTRILSIRSQGREKEEVNRGGRERAKKKERNQVDWGCDSSC